MNAHDEDFWEVISSDSDSDSNEQGGEPKGIITVANFDLKKDTHKEDPSKGEIKVVKKCPSLENIFSPQS